MAAVMSDRVEATRPTAARSDTRSDAVTGRISDYVHVNRVIVSDYSRGNNAVTSPCGITWEVHEVAAARCIADPAAATPQPYKCSHANRYYTQSMRW